MKRLALGIMLCATLSATAGDVLTNQIHKSHLDNGLQVVTVPFDSPGIVSFFVLVRVGSREEVEPGVTGFAHFFEHVMFRGTERFPKEKYNQMLQKLAAAGNANTWLDRTLYYFTGNADDMETMFDIESDRFRYLKYSEHGFKTEAGAVLGEYTKNFASPYRQIYTALTETAFDKHTYKHSTMGFLEDIKNMPNQYQYSLKFYDRFYRPEYCTVMVVGDTTHDRVMDLTKKYFGSWENGGFKAQIPTEPEQKGERRTHVQFDGNTNMMLLGYKGPAFSDVNKDKAAVDLLLNIAFSEKSAIHKKLVQEQQKAAFIEPDATDTRDPYLVGVLAQTFEADDMPMVLKEIEATLDHYKKNLVDPKELADLKSRWRYQMAGAFTTPFAVGNNLATFMWLTGDPMSLNRYYDMVDTVTPEDVRNAAQKYFTKDKRTLVTLSSKEAF